MSGKWVRSRLDGVGEIVSGGTPSTNCPQYWNGTIPFVTPVDLGKSISAHLKNTQRSITEVGLKESAANLLPKDTLIISTRAPIGYLALAAEPSVTNQGCKSVIFDAETSPLFFYYKLHLLVRRMECLGVGTTFSEISKSDLSRLIITYPQQPSVQQHIAEILSTCDEVIEKSERAKAKLRSVKDGLLADLMTRGIGKDGKIRPRPSKAPHLYKQSELGLIPKEWDVKRLGDVCEEPQYGLNAAAVDYDGVHGYIRITDIDDDTHQFMHEGITSPAEFSDSYILKEGDIVLSRTGASVGKSYVYDPKDGLLYFAGFLIRFRCHSDVNHRYVFSQLLTKRYWNWVSAVSMRTGQPGVNAEEYSTYRIVVPQKKDEQDQITDRLAAVDARIESEENAIAKYRKIKAGLMHRLLTPPSGAEIVDLAEGAT